MTRGVKRLSSYKTLPIMMFAVCSIERRAKSIEPVEPHERAGRSPVRDQRVFHGVRVGIAQRHAADDGLFRRKTEHRADGAMVVGPGGLGAGVEAPAARSGRYV